MPKTDCPHCGAKDTWKPDNPFRPFCCERCKQIDFGAWADEGYQIPGEQAQVPDSDPTEEES